MHEDYLEELQRFLRNKPKALSAVVMPDFFLDRLISLEWELTDFCEHLERVVKRKGGSMDGIEQTEIRGGNAINTASALAALDVEVIPITCTSRLGLKIIKMTFKNRRIGFSNIKIFDRASITTALEFKTKSGRTNVMLRDVGSLAEFGPHNLDQKDFEAIENADYVCVFNWAGTKRFGTELAETVFNHTKEKGKGKTYYDTADPTPNKEKISKLVKSVLQSKAIDVLSVNENEAIFYAAHLTNKTKKTDERIPVEKLALKSARILASNWSARVDLHTTNFSATFTKKGEVIVPAFKVPIARATGAGDAWNAGNILGDAHSLSDSCRVALANAVAAYYISNPKGTHPTRKELLGFCQKLQRKKKQGANLHDIRF